MMIVGRTIAPRMAAARGAMQNTRDLSTSRPLKVQQPMDGNQAAAYVAYGMSENSFIYPISPATSMGENMDNWSAAGKKNAFGQVVKVDMMQSEGGAAGALHGAVAAGSLCSTFTASQGLLLMIPNMYMLAGELTPTVIHVSARTVAKHALSIYNDHSDVMACRQTGFAMLCSNGVQEVMDLGLVAHLATLKTSLPFMHFFDGYRTSAEIQNIHTIPYETMSKLMPNDKIQANLKDRALTPMAPVQRATGQRPDIFFQAAVANNSYYLDAPGIVQECMDQVGAETGRHYKLFDYYGAPDADKVMVIMGSASATAEEAVDYLNANGYNIGIIKIRLFRPWSAEHLLAAIPKSATKIAVMDRTREDGAAGNPLFLDVNVTLSDAKDYRLVTGGQYGISSKEFTPTHVKAVFDNLDAESPMMRYVIGINDDVTHTSLAVGPHINTVPDTTKQCIFWGLGGDGTIGANKEAIKTISTATDLKGAQGFFANDSKKTLGVTMSHLRFGPEEVKGQYFINSDADYIACHHPSYIMKFQQICDPIKKGGTFVINCPWGDAESIERNLPPKLKKVIADSNVEFYTIDATSLARQMGLGQRINTVMQTVFYSLSNVLPYDQAVSLLKETISTVYSKKGPEVVKMNLDAVDGTLANLVKVEVPAAWANIDPVEVPRLHTRRPAKLRTDEVQTFVDTIMDPVLALKGDDLPVSAFTPGGIMPSGTAMYEERGVAPAVPVWRADSCTQCNYCAIVCPHAVIRPFLLNRKEKEASPEGYETRKAKGSTELAAYDYTIQLATMDCTGCEVCVASCPDDSLFMNPYEDVIANHYDKGHWEFSMSLPNRGEVMDKFTVKGSQFQQPLMEFSCACSGCGETPYVKLLTQLFGQNTIIANASGCSSVWGGTATTNPYTVDKETQRGPAWGRSLFEDNAEFGFGMALATKSQRAHLKDQVEVALDEHSSALSPALSKAFKNWLKVEQTTVETTIEPICTEIETLLGLEKTNHAILESIENKKNLLRNPSQWIIGGDGWAYDIGFGGLDHVLAKGENVNVLVLDTEMYSNTGGQVSKSTSMSSVVKYAVNGKQQQKKDLGLMAMMYENVYVASIAMGASYTQSVQAFKEAESYNGTSLILAYSPCIDWGIDMKYMMDVQKAAVDTGYWPLYRFDPSKEQKGGLPFQLDAGKIRKNLKDHLSGQNRFSRLLRQDSDMGNKLQEQLDTHNQKRMANYQRMAMDDFELLNLLKKNIGEETSGEATLILYASETGNAEAHAQAFAYEFKRRDIRAKAVAMDDFDIEDLPDQTMVCILAATCGQGDFPANCQNFWEALKDPELPADFLSETKFATFGMGDTSYVYFNEVARLIDERFGALGGTRLMPIGEGDDLAEDKWETAWEEWSPEYWNEIGAKPPPQEMLPSSFAVDLQPAGSGVPSVDIIRPSNTTVTPMEVSVMCTPASVKRMAAGGDPMAFESGERDTRHYEFNLEGLVGMDYGVGDCLGVYPQNLPTEVDTFLQASYGHYGLSPDSVINLENLDITKPSYYPETMTAQQLFTQGLDIFGKPGRRFYEMLSMTATDPAEKAELQRLITKEGKDDFRSLTNETTHVADLLLKFPSAVPSLDYLIEFCPNIKPRLYSIASAPEMVGNRVHLCIVADDWDTPSGKYQHGVCTKYLKGLEMPNSIVARMNPAAVHMPADPSAPMMMVGLGTGLAPIRAMLQQREVQATTSGCATGDMALFFGARTRNNDYLYEDELENLYHKDGNGILTHIINAFSREQEHKIYVQNRVRENPDLVYNLLVKQKGYFYLCGPAGAAPTAVRRAIQECFMEVGGHSEEEADKMLINMQINGHYNLEVW